MALPLLASTSKNNGANVNFTSDPINTTGGGLLVVAKIWFGASAEPALSDSLGLTWTDLTVQGSTIKARLSYVIGGTRNAAHTVSLGTSSNGFAALAFAAFVPGGTVTADGVDVGAQGSSSSVQPGTGTPAGANRLFITAVGDDGTLTINSSFIKIEECPAVGGSAFGIGLAYKIASAAENPTWSIAGGATNATAAMTAFADTGSWPTGGGGGTTAGPLVGSAILKSLIGKGLVT